MSRLINGSSKENLLKEESIVEDYVIGSSLD